MSWKAGGGRFWSRRGGGCGGGAFTDFADHPGDVEGRGTLRVIVGARWRRLIIGAQIEDETFTAKGHGVEELVRGLAGKKSCRKRRKVKPSPGSLSESAMSSQPAQGHCRMTQLRLKS